MRFKGMTFRISICVFLFCVLVCTAAFKKKSVYCSFFFKHDEVNLAQSSVPSSEMDGELLITMVTNATNAILTRLQSMYHIS